ncbi:MAG: hypothetical protein H0X37_21385 [Herpetosiphonaceae bacterium]|nr:hypothetical protein [Herpetosiphonaceae bacterium]
MTGPEGYQELPPFIGTTGREKLVWRVSWLNAITFMFSLIGGRTIGPALFGHTLAGMLATVLIIVGSVALTLEYHGLLLGRRVLIRLLFVARWFSRRTMINGVRWADTVLDDALHAAPQPVLMAGGQGLTLVGPALDDGDGYPHAGEGGW